MNRKKVIQVLPSFGRGGAQALVTDYLLNIDQTVFVPEVLIIGENQNSAYERVLNEKGVKIVYLHDLIGKIGLGGKIGRIVYSMQWRKALRRYFSENAGAVVHAHLHVMNTLLAARKQLTSCKLLYTVHSDPDRYWGDGKRIKEKAAIDRFIANNDLTLIAINRDMVPKLRNLFGNGCNIRLLNNAIDFSKYQQPSDCGALKQSLHISPDAFVVGHVGRFVEVKNHSFLIDIFEEILRINPNSFLLLVGEGPLIGKTKEYVSQKKLENHVIFAGLRDDVNALLTIMDVFVLPSIWEGFPITVLEAQAANKRCIISSAVTREVRLTNRVSFVDVKEEPVIWAKKIVEEDASSFVDYGLKEYDISTVLKHLSSIYLE